MNNDSSESKPANGLDNLSRGRCPQIGRAIQIPRPLQRIAFLLFLLFCHSAFGQSYYLDWFKVAGGGGTSASTDGLYSASVTIGQQDAGGPMQGPGYSVESGFWSLYAVQTASPTGSAPQITSQPQSQFVYQGDPASFTVSVTGTPPLYYQWQKNGVNLINGGDVCSSRTTNLVFSAASISDGGSYSLSVENAYGSVTSSVVMLTVVLLPNSQNLFLAEFSGNIYEFTPNGGKSTFASGLGEPFALTFNSAGNLFVADAEANRIYEFTPNGVKSTFASDLNEPTGLAFNDAGQLFESDWGSSNIYEFTTNRVKSTFASGLNHPEGLAFNSAGDLFVANQGGLSGTNITEITPGGTQTTFASGLESPDGLAFSEGGDLFVANQGPVENASITEITPGGMPTSFASGMGSLNELAFNSAGNLFVADGGSENIYEFTPSGAQTVFASGLDGPGGLAFPPVQSTTTNLIDEIYGVGAGSFELGDYNTNDATATGPQNNYGLTGGWVWGVMGTTITGWICTSNVDWDWDRWLDADGSKDVELGGDANPASIYTTLILNAGTTYTLNFALSSTPTYNPGIVQVTFGTTTQMFTNSATTSFTDMQWQTNTMTFTPTASGNYQLQFYHPLFGSIPVIDAVSVNAPVQVTNQPPTIGQYVQPTIETSSASRGEFTFSWNNLPAYPPVDYQVQYTTNLLSPWINLGNVITNSVTSFTASVGSNPQGFYRVILVQ